MEYNYLLGVLDVAMLTLVHVAYSNFSTICQKLGLLGELKLVPTMLLRTLV